MSQAASFPLAGLPSDLAQFVRQQVATGKYSTETDVVTQGLRLLRVHEERMDELRQLVQPAIESLDRGEGIELEDDADLDRFFDDIITRGLERLDAKGKHS